MDFFKNLKNLLFLDIETVACEASYELLDSRLQAVWDKKALYFASENQDVKSLFAEKAAIYAEFGKVVTIAIGFFYLENDELCFKVKPLADKDERTLLVKFKDLLESKFDQKKLILCAHNGKEFDFPYLCRRMLVNQVCLPDVLQLAGKKPWEVNHLDTMEMWKFGDKKSYTSLELLAALFQIPTSKDEMDGSMVSKVYYSDGDMEKVCRYCAKDVIVTAQLYLKLHNLPLIKEDNIHIV